MSSDSIILYGGIAFVIAIIITVVCLYFFTNIFGNNNTPVDCVMNPWTDYDSTGKRTRTIKTPAKYGGKACGTLFEKETPINCIASTWTVDPDMGIKKRSILTEAKYGGIPCGSLSELADIDCVMNTDFGDCTLGANGKYYKVKGVKTPAKNKGQCPVEEPTLCPATNCIYNYNWTPYNSTGLSTMTATEATYGGTKCDPTLMVDQKIPVNCEISKWGKCNPGTSGTYKRIRKQITTPNYGGKVCDGNGILEQDCTNASSVINIGDTFSNDNIILSPKDSNYNNNRSWQLMFEDGNLIMKNTYTNAIYNNYIGGNATSLKFTQGHVRLYDKDNNKVAEINVSNSNTKLIMQTDARLVAYDPDGISNSQNINFSGK